MTTNKILQGDTLTKLKKIQAESIDTIITSPPYWGLRDYGVKGQLGLEKTPEEYVEKLVKIFREAKRVLKKEGTVWLNLGDSYVGGGRAGNEGIQKWGGIEKSNNRKYGKPQPIPNTLKQKDLVGIPWRVAFALQKDGWYLRQDIIWSKPNPMPESVTDRCTKSHEYVFLLTKNPKYYYNGEAIKENTQSTCIRKRSSAFRQQDEDKDLTLTTTGRNKRSVWTITTKPYKEAHFATFPEALIEPMVLAGCPENVCKNCWKARERIKEIGLTDCGCKAGWQPGIALDIFIGSGTTAVVAKKLKRNWLGIELNPEYIKIAEARIKNTPNPLL
jgi:DNA modification methylase